MWSLALHAFRELEETDNAGGVLQDGPTDPKLSTMYASAANSDRITPTPGPTHRPVHRDAPAAPRGTMHRDGIEPTFRPVHRDDPAAPRGAVLRDGFSPTPGASTVSAVAALFVYECERDVPGLLIPRPEAYLVVRFGPGARSGLDAHAFGARQKVHRKILHDGQRTITARLHLGAQRAVLGVSADEIAGRVLALEDLWGSAKTRRLFERLAAAPGTLSAAEILERAIAERLASSTKSVTHTRLALEAAKRLTSATVASVAADLGVSERQLRRVFHDAIGMSPKRFAMLTRFERAIFATRDRNQTNWASVAAAAGYYDQAHLIAEFRRIANATPQAFLSELRSASALPI
ncbi:MAG: AraC family transcriptional regulator [Polyangiaceae bacterium]